MKTVAVFKRSRRVLRQNGVRAWCPLLDVFAWLSPVPCPCGSFGVMSNAAGIYSRDLYNRLVAAFRESGGIARRAARIAGVHEQTARKAFVIGWPRYEWARPIQEVLAEERTKGLSIVAERARRDAARAIAEAAEAKGVAVEAVAQEQSILTAARKNVLAVLGLSARLVPAMDSLVDVVRSATLRPDGTKRPPTEIKIGPEAALNILSRHASILARAMAIGEQVVTLGRAERGQASNIIGIAVADMTADQASDLIEEQEAAISLIRSAAKHGEIHNVPRLLGGTPKARATKPEIVEHREALEAFGAGAPAETDPDVEPAAVPRVVSS